jgi:O-antigen ligase
VLAGIDPKFALAGAIGLVFLVLTLGNVTFGLCVFTVVAFVDVLPDFGGAFFSFAKLTGALLAASWAATIAVRGRRERGFVSNHPFVAYAIALFLAWGAVSALWSEDAARVGVILPRYVLNLILFLIVYAAVRYRREAVMVTSAYVVGASVAAAFAVLGPRGWAGPNEVARATGTVGDANELAAVLLPGFVLALVLTVITRRAPLARLAAGAAAGTCLLALLLTLSRGGLVGLGCALLAAIACGGRWRPIAAGAAVTIALLTVGYFTLVATPVERQRVMEVEGGTGRTDIWTVGMRMVRAHPVAGVGLGNFQTSSVHYLLEPGAIKRSEFIVDEPKVAHNTFLELLAELGAVGFALFLAIIAFSMSAAWRAARAFAARGDHRMELLARGVLVSLVGILAADFFISANFQKQLWLLLGMCPALLVLARRARVEEPRPARASDPPWAIPGRLEPAPGPV